MSLGIVNKTIVHPREVFYRAIKNLATGVIICHNHPCGDTNPSDDDKDVTKTICDSGKIIGIKVLDHLIITKTGFFSFTQNGYIDKSGGYVDEKQ
jgi:DNA repair protein RadC